MKTSQLTLATASIGAACQLIAGPTNEPVRLSLDVTPAVFQLSWPAAVLSSTGGLVRPYFEIQRSVDLQRWQPIGERQHAGGAAEGELMQAPFDPEGARAFYRLMIVDPEDAAHLGSGGAEVFGYGDAFANELQRTGGISPEQFASQFEGLAPPLWTRSYLVPKP